MVNLCTAFRTGCEFDSYTCNNECSLLSFEDILLASQINLSQKIYSVIPKPIIHSIIQKKIFLKFRIPYVLMSVGKIDYCSVSFTSWFRMS